MKRLQRVAWILILIVDVGYIAWGSGARRALGLVGAAHPGAGGLVSEPATGPPTALLDAIYRFDFAMWAIMRVAPTIMHYLVAVPAALLPSLQKEDRAKLDEAARMILPVSSRRLGVLNDAKTQGSARQYPLARVTVPTLLISAADDLYRTLSSAREAARRIPHAKLTEFATGGHLLLGRESEVWPAVATFLQQEAINQPAAHSGKTNTVLQNTDWRVSA